jgi:hypothetical protein
MGLNHTLKVIYEHLTGVKQARFAVPLKIACCAEATNALPANASLATRGPRSVAAEWIVDAQARAAPKWKRRRGFRRGGVMDDMQ